MNTVLKIAIILLLACPCIAMGVAIFFQKKKHNFASRCQSYLIGISFLISLYLLKTVSSGSESISYLLLIINPLNILLSTLVLFISFIIHRFSIRYMDGDLYYTRYFFSLSTITLTVILMVLANNLFLFWFAWTLSNLLLVALMIHKQEWVAAKNSGWLALKTLIPGSLSLLTAFFFLYSLDNTASIYAIIQHSRNDSSITLVIALGLIILTSLTQSAIWPFHKWLISSLNSPTPVSALMHAGIVNGGGILIVKFAPLFAMQKPLLFTLFLLGTLSALFGTLWKLLQSDIKRMLASSTLAQMGFMMMQCGLGLFPAAIAHICWHSMFKAYLFLSSGSAVAQKKYPKNSSKKNPLILIISLVGGLLGTYTFALITGKPLFTLEATTFLLVFAFMAATQFTYTIIGNHLNLKRVILGLVLALLTGFFYGESIHMIEALFPNLKKYYVPELNSLHLIVLSLFLGIWTVFNLDLLNKLKKSKLWLWIYMNLLNSSQPDPKTITSSRSSYHY